jgi:hypothetical protein
MRAAAQQDEQTEQREQITERQIGTLAGEIDQAHRNGIIGDPDPDIRQDMQPQNPRLPKETMSMRNEFVGAECRRDLVKQETLPNRGRNIIIEAGVAGAILCAPKAKPYSAARRASSANVASQCSPM